MNAIKVPRQYKHELRNDAPIEYKRAEIRDYIKAHEGEVIKLADFVEKIGSSAPTHLRNLRREGYVLRYQIHNSQRGYSYGYKWIDNPQPVQLHRNGDVKVLSMGFDPWPLGTEEATGLLTNAIELYLEDHVDELTDGNLSGIIKFKKHMKQRHADVQKQRREILEGGKDETSSN